MNLTKQDIYLVLACFDHNNASQDQSLDSAVAMIIGQLVTATNADRLKVLEAMRKSAIDVMDQLPELIEKLNREIAAVQPPAPTAPKEAAYFDPFGPESDL